MTVGWWIRAAWRTGAPVSRDVQRRAALSGAVIVALCLGMLYGPSAAVAQAVAVRSGAHDGFVRLTFDLLERVPFEITQTGRRAVLILPEGPDAFDLSAIFQRIPRGRLIAISPPQDGAGLKLELGCLCRLNGFWHDASMLVIDISDPLPAGAEGLAAPSPPVRRQSRAPKVDDASVAPLPVSAWAQSRRPSLAASMFSDPPVPAAAVVPGLRDSAAVSAGGAVPDPPYAARALEDARTRLQEQLARAGSQGLLELRPGAAGSLPVSDSTSPQPPHETSGSAPPVSADGPATPPPAASEADAPAPGDQAAVLGNRPAAPAGSHLRAETAVDRGFGSRNQMAKPTSASVPACLPDSAVAVQDWGGDRPFASALARLRSSSIREFDRAAPRALRDLARFYLHYGFGAEARQAIAMADEAAPDAPVLRALAAIMDDGRAAPDSPLTGQLDCPGTVVLWSAMAMSDWPPRGVVDEAAIRRAFAIQPRHLRRHLGPTLARRARSQGYPVLAAQILRMIDLTGAASLPEAALAQAELEFSTNDPNAFRTAAEATGAADAMLDRVVRDNSRAGAEALLIQIRTRLARNEGIPPEMAELAGAFAQENRDTPFGADLARGYLSALTATGEFNRAFREYGRLEPDLEPPARRRVRSDLMRYLARDAGPVGFLSRSLSVARAWEDELPMKDANAVAARLLDLGFAERAAPYLAKAASGTGARGSAKTRRRLLRARMALMLDRPRQAQLELVDVIDPSATALRAQIRARLGEHGAARVLFSSIGREDAALRQAWLAGDWRHLAGSGSTILSALGRMMIGRDSVPPAADQREPGLTVAPSGDGPGQAAGNGGPLPASKDVPVLVERGGRTAERETMPLARARQLLAQSAQARQILGAVLTAHPMPKPDGRRNSGK